MTDDEIIRLFEETEVEGLTEPTLELLRERMRDSPRVREALRGRLSLEQALASVAQDIRLPVEDIFREARRRSAQHTRFRVICVGFLLLLGGVWVGTCTSGKSAKEESSVEVVEVAEVAAGTNPCLESSSQEPRVSSGLEPPSPGRLEIEAESFLDANVNVVRWGPGEGIGVICNGGSGANYAIYRLSIPRAARYQLEIRYAARKPRPFTVAIDERVVFEKAGRATTGGWFPGDQRWIKVGVVALERGEHELRLSTQKIFSNIDKLALTEVEALREVPGVALGGRDAASEVVPMELAYGGVRKAFEETLYDDFDHDSAYPTLRQLRSWLAPVPVVKGDMIERKVGDRTVCRIAGFFELRPVSSGLWEDDWVLRLNVQDPKGFGLHLWDGHQGLTIQYHSGEGVWAAHRSACFGDFSRSERLELLASDSGRYRRGGEGTVEIRRQAGQLVLSRGGLMLLSAPLAAKPGKVFLEGNMVVKGLALYRGSAFPDPSETQRLSVWSIECGSPMAWQSPVNAPVSVETLLDGCWRLAAQESLENAAHAFTPAGCNAPFEVVFQIDEATPGVGVYLGDGAGQPLGAVGVFKRASTGHLVVAPADPNSRQSEILVKDDDGLLPLVGRSFWLRLTASPWGLRVSSSSDGRHWGEVLLPQKPPTPPRYETVGIYVAKGVRAAALRVRRIEVLQLRDLTEVLRGRSLEAHSEDLFETILEWASENSTQTKFAIGAIEGAALIEGRMDGFDLSRIERALECLAGELADGGYPPPRQRIFSALLGARFPIGSRFDPIVEGLFRSEAIESVYLCDWARARSLTRWFGMWALWGKPTDGKGGSVQSRESRSRSRAMAAWAQGVWVQHSPSSPVDLTQQVIVAQHPLIAEPSKEGYNVLAELQEALASESYRDACEILAAAEVRGVEGLVTDSRDADLLVSFPRAVKLALKDNPPLERTLREKFGPLSMLRFREAKAESDASAMRLITLEFLGTEAACEAHAWLGDRLMAVGEFADALSHYEKALEGLSGPSRPRILARLRLVAAYLGGNLSAEALPTEVDLGGARMLAASIEQLVSGIRKSGSSTAGLDATEESIPPPGKYSTRLWARAEHLCELKPRGLPKWATHWMERQLALTVENGMRIFSDRSQVIAWELSRGERLWALTLKEDGGRWPFVPMVPRLVGESVLSRRMTANGPELCGIHAKTGALLWRTRLGNHVASDLLVSPRGVYVLAVDASNERLLDLSLVQVEPRSGEVLSRTVLARFRDVWDRQIPCRATLIGSDGILASVGGVTLRASFSDGVVWMRRHTVLPPAQDPYGFELDPAPPLVDGDRVLTLPGGVRCVEAFNARSGRLEWRRVLLRASRLCGVAGGNAIVREPTCVVALKAVTGAVAWRRNIQGLVRVERVGIQSSRAPGQVSTEGPALVLCIVEEGSGSRIPCLLWLDAATGAEVGRAPLAELAHESPNLGPLCVVDDTIWALFRRGQSREIEVMEIAPR